MALSAGAAATLVCFKWRGRYSPNSERGGVPRAGTFRARARSNFGDGRLAEVRREADIPVRITNGSGEFVAFALEADIPSSLRTGVGSPSRAAGSRPQYFDFVGTGG